MPRLGQMPATQAKIHIVGGRSANKIPLGVGAIGRITPTIEVAPGNIVEVSQITLQYQGPAKSIAIGAAWKPKTGFLGTDFNNGNNILNIPGSMAIVSGGGVSLPAQGSLRGVTIAPSVGARLTVPAPGEYPLRGGGTGRINEGNADVWVWLIDLTKADTSQSGFATNEANFVTPSESIISDGAVATIKAAVSLQVSSLNAGYRKV